MNEAEVSQDNDGLNVGLSRIWYGGPNFEFASLILNKDKGIIGVKSDSADTWRTAVYVREQKRLIIVLWSEGA